MAKKLSKEDAVRLAEKMGVDFEKDFYAQSFGEELTNIAKLVGYRKPKSASGSTGRYFFYYLQKVKENNFWL